MLSTALGNKMNINKTKRLETATQRKRRLEKEKRKREEKKVKLCEADRNRKKEQSKLYMRQYRANETSEKRKSRLKAGRQYSSHARASQSEKERAARLQYLREQNAKSRAVQKTAVCEMCTKRCYQFQVSPWSVNVENAPYLPDELQQKSTLILCSRCKTHVNNRRNLPPSKAFWNNHDPAIMPRRPNIGRSTSNAKRMRSVRNNDNEEEREVCLANAREGQSSQRRRECSVERNVRLVLERERHRLLRERHSLTERNECLLSDRNRHAAQRKRELSVEREQGLFGNHTQNMNLRNSTQERVAEFKRICTSPSPSKSVPEIPSFADTVDSVIKTEDFNSLTSSCEITEEGIDLETLYPIKNEIVECPEEITVQKTLEEKYAELLEENEKFRQKLVMLETTNKAQETEIDALECNLKKLLHDVDELTLYNTKLQQALHAAQIVIPKEEDDR